METQSKTVTQCDACKMPIAKSKEEKIDNIQATLHNGLGETKDYHFCDEECLRVFLNSRAKKHKSKSSVLELELNKKN